MAKVITLRLDTENGTYLCDTYKDSSIQITKRVQSIDTLNSSQGVITQQTFRVPLIGGMSDALGDLTELQIAPKVDIRKSIKGSIIVDGYPRFNGSFQVVGIYKNEESNLKEVELLFKGSETDLKATLTAIKLSDLLKGMTLPYQTEEIVDYMQNTSTYIESGFCWPLIDYGALWTADPNDTGRKIGSSDLVDALDVTDFKPAIFLSKVFDLLPVKITVDTTAIDLLNQVIPLHNNSSNLAIIDASPSNYTGNLGFISDGSLFTDYFPDVSPISASPIEIDFQTAYNYNEAVFSESLDAYTAQASMSVGFNYNLSVAVKVNSGTPVPLYVSAYIENVTQGTVNALSLSIIIPNNSTYTSANIGGRIAGLYMNKNDVIKVRYKMYTNNPSSDMMIDYYVKSNTKFNAVSSDGVLFGPTLSNSVVLLDKNAPELTAWDCVRTIITQCNGVLETTENGYNIKPWVKWVDEGTIYNLEDKIDANKDLSIEPTNVTGAKSILLTYQEDGDFLNKIYTDLFERPYGNLYINDTGTDFTKEEFKIEIPFAATPITYIKNSNIPIPKFLSTDLKCVKTKPRLLYYNNSRAGGAMSFINRNINVIVGIVIDGFPLFSHWENISGGYNTRDYNFGTTLNFFEDSGFPNNTLYERFWKQYLAETYGPKSRKVKLSLRISQNDFDNFKMNEKLYYKGNLLRFLSINNLDIINEEFTDCELVFRVTEENIDIAPYYPYDIINQIVQFKDSTDNTVVSFPDATDLRISCEAYGYFYDANLNQCVQRGNIIQI